MFCFGSLWFRKKTKKNLYYYVGLCKINFQLQKLDIQNQITKSGNECRRIHSKQRHVFIISLTWNLIVRGFVLIVGWFTNTHQMSKYWSKEPALGMWKWRGLKWKSPLYWHDMKFILGFCTVHLWHISPLNYSFLLFLFTCRVSVEESDCGCYHIAVQGVNAAKCQFHQGSLEPFRQQREQEEWQVGDVAHVAQGRCHDVALRSLGHALDGGEEHDGLNDLWQW